MPHPKEFTAAQWDPQDGTLGRLPPHLRSRIKATEQDVESPEAEAIETVLLNLFTHRSDIPPDCALDSLSKVNPELFALMEGPSDFRPWTGSLKNFNAMPRLGELSNLPMFLNSGEFDIVRPVIIEEMHAKLTLSETLLFAGSGHISALDATGELNSAIADFLERVEESAAAGKQFVPKETKTSAERTQRASSKVWRIVGSTMILAVGFLVGRYSGGANRYERL